MCQTPAEPAADGKMRARSTHTQSQVSVYQNAGFPSRCGRLYYYILHAIVYYYLVVVLMYINADNDHVV